RLTLAGGLLPGARNCLLTLTRAVGRRLRLLGHLRILKLLLLLAHRLGRLAHGFLRALHVTLTERFCRFAKLLSERGVALRERFGGFFEAPSEVFALLLGHLLPELARCLLGCFGGVCRS